MPSILTELKKIARDFLAVCILISLYIWTVEILSDF